MPDNTTLNIGSGGDVLRDVAKGSSKTPVSIIDIGAGTSELLVTTGAKTSANSFPVVIASDQAALAVTGTFFQATQPVSLASLPTLAAGTNVIGHVVVDTAPTTAITAAALPLPSGASTAAKQPALGTAGTASSDVLTIQGIASMTAVKVDGSAVTQPVSLASVPALAAGSALIGQTITAQQTNQLFTGTTALTPQFAVINASTNGDGNTIVAATGGKKIRVLWWAARVGATAVTFKFRDYDGVSTYTDLSGLCVGLANQPFSGAYCPVGRMITQTGHALTMNLSAGNAVNGELAYVLE